MKWSDTSRHMTLSDEKKIENLAKYIIISQRERERLYEECFWDIPYIGYLDSIEVKERQIKEQKTK